jgi:large subunit ribosomal protein L30
MPRTFVWHPGKGPATTQSAKQFKDGDMVRIKQVRSKIGHEARMRRTLEALGLRNHQAVIERPMSPALRGQIKHVRHLLEVTAAGETGSGKSGERAKRATSNKTASASKTPKTTKTEK